MAIEIHLSGGRDAPPAQRKRVLLAGPGPYRMGRSKECEIVLDHPQVSRMHCEVKVVGKTVTVADNGGTNGTQLEGQRITNAEWKLGQRLAVGPYTLTFTWVTEPEAEESEDPLLLKEATELIAAPVAARASKDDFPGSLFAQRIVPIKAIEATGKLSGTTLYATIGGGMGSFCWVDYLRNYGVPASAIRVLGVANDKRPYAKYDRLCRNSQIPDHERLRSNSISAPDNIWGFPGYASRECVRDLLAGRFSGLKHVLQVFGEEMLTESFTPQIGDVKRACDAEARRIGWEDMWMTAQVVGVRKTDDERFVIAYRVPSGPGQPTDPAARQRFIVAQYVHIATGYPAFNFLPDLRDFRHAHPQSRAVVNAYEDHEDVYRYLQKNGGTVVLRGRGIVASRIIQKLWEVRQGGADIRILHLVRGPVKEGHKYDLATRPVRNDVEHQPFNWPKASWGGTYRKFLEDSSPQDRARLFAVWGGTTTVNRASWNNIIDEGTQAGWYKILYGNVRSIMNVDGRVETRLESTDKLSDNVDLTADFVIDCTGLIASLDETPFIADLIRTYDLPRNGGSGGDGEARRLSGITVTNDFAIPGLANGRGNVWAAGVVVINGPYAAVDSFLGLQYVALRSVDRLGELKAPHVSRFGPIRSFWQWTKWCRGVPP